MTYRGRHFDVESAKVWDLPETASPIGIAVSGPVAGAQRRGTVELFCAVGVTVGGPEGAAVLLGTLCQLQAAMMTEWQPTARGS